MRVHEYGCLAPTTNRDAVMNQMRLANRYQNKLIELEHWRRQRSVEILARDSTVAEIEAKIVEREAFLEKVRAVIKDLSAVKRRKEDRAYATKDVLAQLRVLRAERKVARKLATTNFAADLAKLQSEVSLRQAQLRSECGVYWGNYLPIEAAVYAAQSAKNPPKFKAWRGEGGVSVQLQTGLAEDRLFSGTDLRVRIDRVPEEVYGWTRSARKRGTRTTLNIRIGSDGRKPIWATFPMILHRPLPAGCKIKWVRVQRRLIADHEKWTCKITFDSAKNAPAPISTGQGMVAVNLGWRKQDGEQIRVGFAVGEDGVEREVQVPARVGERLRKSEDLRSIRDKMFDRAKELLTSWVQSLPIVPEWMKEKVSHASQWRSQRRMVLLIKEWKSQHASPIASESGRSHGSVSEETVLKWLTFWYHRDRHLWQWEAHNRSKAYGHRREVFRCFAAKLAKQYATLAVGKVDLRDFAAKALPEQKEERTETARYQRALAAPSSLRMALFNAFQRTSKPVEVPGPYTPSCSDCGEINTVGEPLKFVCSGCSRTWDQDNNASRNILRAARLQGPVPEPLEKPKLSRTQRFLASKAEKRARREADLELPT